jgi:hypothetical protein
MKPAGRPPWDTGWTPAARPVEERGQTGSSAPIGLMQSKSFIIINVQEETGEEIHITAGLGEVKKGLTLENLRYTFKTAIQEGELGCANLRARQPFPASKYGDSESSFQQSLVSAGIGNIGPWIPAQETCASGRGMARITTCDFTSTI